VTVTRNIAKLEPDYTRGTIGCDLNDQHVSRTRVDAKGEFIDTKDLALRMAGRCSGQRLALIHEVAHELICEALKLGVPIVIERLDFFLKKMRLRDVGCARSARRLSSFAYSRFAAVLKSHARLHGVCVVEVDPAYTSVIGAALHAVPMGLTVHGAAAMGFSGGPEGAGNTRWSCSAHSIQMAKG
jgi:IS605 OrfB family transposase